MRAASFWIFSRSFDSYWVQLSQTTLEYSRRGLINDVYIISSDFLSSWNFSLRMMFNLNQDLALIWSMCSCQLPSSEKISPKCLCDVTSLMFSWAIFKGGCRGLFCLRESVIDSDLEGLKDTSHLEAHKWIFARSAFNKFAACWGLSTMM